MPTLLLSPRYTDDSRALRRAAEAARWGVLRTADWRPPQQRDFAGGVALYGEPLFVDVIAAALDLTVLDAPVDWLAHLPRHLTGRGIIAMPLAEALMLREARFVKPAGAKAFPAGVCVMASGAPAACHALPGDLPVLVADPVTWEIEFRGFVLERRLVALSPYLRRGELVEAADGTWVASDAEWAEARAYYDAILADPALELPPAIVLDVGRIAGQGWAVIETNGAWGAGLYGCDPTAVLPVLARATRSAATLAAEEQRWARPRVEVEP